MRDAALTIAVGLVSGLLSGQFGIGGGLVTTPAIRLLLGYPALIAVGTPLLVILPTALAGAVSYARRGLADLRAGLVMGMVGALGSVAGASASQLLGGSTIMIATAAMMLYVAVDMANQTARGRVTDTEAGVGTSEADPAEAHVPAATPRPPARGPLWRFAAIGAVAGVYSGLLGLGGGFIVVPALMRWLGFPLKRAIGTSLVTVAILAVPGTVTHYLLGNVDLALAALLVVGTVPGAIVGARLTALARERVVGIAFSVVLGATGLILGGVEIARLVG
jgi:uncharacterized membrane protein YfcA